MVIYFALRRKTNLPQVPSKVPHARSRFCVNSVNPQGRRVLISQYKNPHLKKIGTQAFLLILKKIVQLDFSFEKKCFSGLVVWKFVLFCCSTVLLISKKVIVCKKGVQLICSSESLKISALLCYAAHMKKSAHLVSCTQLKCSCGLLFWTAQPTKSGQLAWLI